MEPRKLYRIGEVSRITATKAFVLRYWETEFPMLRPVKSAKGQRRYREQDIAVIEEIKRLLYEEGFTIAGARKHMKEAGAGAGAGTLRSNAFDSLDDTADISPPLRNQGRRALRGARDELRAILKLLNEK